MDLPTSPAEWERLLAVATPEERAEIDAILAADMVREVWRPQVGQQTLAMQSQAYITGYGGAAGGGKSDLIAGLALTQHKRALILRREKAQTDGIVQRMTEIVGSTDGYNSQKSVWRYQDRLIEFGGLDNPDDHQKWQGRAHDLKAYDEVTEMRESQVRFTMGWARGPDPKQRARILMTFNPPTTAEGRWVIDFFGPWLDEKHRNPAQPGELRWFTTIKGKDAEVESEKPFVLFKGEPVYDFDPMEFSAEKIITPKSRTFIPSRVTDNYFYLKTGYIDTLQSMPEPLRSQMLNGDFKAGMEDDAYQVIPTAWVDAAIDRWEPRHDKGVMNSMGVDVARGGRDQTIISRRHGSWFDDLICKAGATTPDGPTVATETVLYRRDQAPVHIDVVGWGSSPFDFLNTNGVHAIPVNGASKSHLKTIDGRLSFVNKRAELWWKMREALDPHNRDPIALPDNTELRADLCAPKWKLVASGIQIESKDDLIKRLGRSPDRGDAVCMANMVTVPRDFWESEEQFSNDASRSSHTGY